MPETTTPKPNYTAVPMGIGRVGNSKIILKRNFRYIFEIQTPYGLVPKHYVQTAGKPQLETEELEVSFLNQTTWFPGRSKWQPITVTYLDTNDIEMKPLYDWISSIYNFDVKDDANIDSRYTQTEKPGWASYGILKTLDGCGTVLEIWEFGNMWPTTVNFGELSNGDSEASKIELTFRYSDVKHLTNGCSPVGVGTCYGCE